MNSEGNLYLKNKDEYSLYNPLLGYLLFTRSIIRFRLTAIRYWPTVLDLDFEKNETRAKKL